MLIERNEFRLKFGKAKEAIAIWKEILSEAKNAGSQAPPIRILTDISGPAYTLVMEMKLKDVTEINPKNYTWVTNPKYTALYQQFLPLCESSRRTYYTVEME